jgi:NCS1 family nucleobase:cation symporter-1
MAQDIDRVDVTDYDSRDGYVELNKSFPESKTLWNADFQPTPFKNRTWGAWTYFAIWFGMAVEVESWSLVSVGFDFGLNWFWSILSVFIGNIAVLVPILIIGHGGAKYGMPETSLTRSRWGTYGTFIPSFARGLIGAGWWGIDTWIITESFAGMYIDATGLKPELMKLVAVGNATPFTIASMVPGVFIAVFVSTIIARLVILYFAPPRHGQTLLKKLSWVVPFIAFIGLVLVFAVNGSSVGWDFTPVFQIKTTVSGSTFIYFFIALVNAQISFWATMGISMPDYTRYAKSQKSAIRGQITLPFMMLGIGFMAILTAGVTIVKYHTAIYDPVLLATISLPSYLLYVTLFLLMLGVLVVNIFADTVGPGYDFSNIYPKLIPWFGGVLIVVAIAAALQSWSFYASAGAYVETWLDGYGAILGAVEGVLIFDYVIIRRFKFEAVDSFLPGGRFKYYKGFNPAAVIAFVVSLILVYPPSSYLPVSFSLYPYQSWVYQGSWIFTIIFSGIIYIIMMKYWIIPKYQPELKGGLLHGYIADDTKKIFQEEGTE